MIASLRGILRATGPDHLVVETGGIGFLIYAPRTVLDSAGPTGEKIFLHTFLVVREDALNLYGFATLEQRSLFETLLRVTGIGPRVAIHVLSSLTPDELRVAVANNDTARVAKVPGIGKKMAERLVLELKSKLDLTNLPGTPPADTDSVVATVNNDLIDLLVSLGYSVAEANSAVASLPPDAPSDLEERLRLALKYFGSA
jgi:Holliday junction DNA helicase RuvA